MLSKEKMFRRIQSAVGARWRDRVSQESLASVAGKMIRGFAGLPLTEVAAQSLLAGLVFSALETGGRIAWGHEALLAANIPIVAWAAARSWTDRKPPVL